MANLLLSSGRNLPFINAIRRISSFNNNRIRSGISGILTNNDELNIWSENNWTQFAKQFTNPIEFPLPGQIGIVLEINQINNKLSNKSRSRNRNNLAKKETIAENLNYLLNKPLSQENQVIKLKEAAGAIFLKTAQTDKNNFNQMLKINKSFELKAYNCPISLIKDFETYFRMNSLENQPLTLITVSFKSENDMSNWNSEVENEREALIENFVDTAQDLCNLLEKEGHWADYIDPSSGQPYKSPNTHATFYETDERYRQLGFEILDYGCCKVISHHKWGTRAYVGCILTNASKESKFVKDITSRFN